MKKVLTGILIISVAVALLLIYQSYLIEEQNKTVEFAMSYGDITRLSRYSSFDDVLAAVKKRGVSDIIVYRTSIKDLLDKGLIRIYSGWEILDINKYFDTGNDFIKKLVSIENDTPYKQFLITGEEQIASLLKKNFSTWKVYNQGKFYVFELPRGEKVDINYKLNYDPVTINNFKDKGFDITYKLSDLKSLSMTEIDYKNVLVDEQLKPKDLDKNNLKLIFIESEMEKSVPVIDTGNKIIRGYLRPPHPFVNEYIIAVRDRNIRYVIFKPVFGNIEKPLEFNLNFLQEITDKIKKSGFNLGKSKEFRSFHPALMYKIIVAMGMGSLVCLFIDRVFTRKINYILLYLIVTVFGISALAPAGVKVISLIAAVVAPVYAVITYKSVDYSKMETSKVLKIIKLLGLNFLGIVLIRGFNSGTNFMLGIEPFRGIKAAYIGSFVLFAFVIFIKEKKFKHINKPVFSIRDMLLLAVGVYFVYVLINRTGNQSLIPITQTELKIRTFLENVLWVRPRTKEFLIGIPALVLKTYEKGLSNTWRYVVDFMVLIGLSSMVNTFLHFHSPVKIAFLRTFEGIVIGVLIGVIVHQVFKVLIKTEKQVKDRE